MEWLRFAIYFPKSIKGAKWFLSLQSRDGLGQYSQIILLYARACANISNDVKEVGTFSIASPGLHPRTSWKEVKAVVPLFIIHQSVSIATALITEHL